MSLRNGLQSADIKSMKTNQTASNSLYPPAHAGTATGGESWGLFHHMNELTEYKKNGFTFTLIKRFGNFALFCGVKNGGRHSNWEVIEIQSHDGMTIAGKIIDPAEYPPNNNQWGTKGWTFLRSETALNKIKELTGGACLS